MRQVLMEVGVVKQRVTTGIRTGQTEVRGTSRQALRAPKVVEGKRAIRRIFNASQVSDLSHDEAGWRLVEFGDDIPYEAALVGARQVATPTSRRLQREAAERLGLIPS